METQTAVKYRGASFCRTIKLPATPPRPLQAVTAAAITARFHWLHLFNLIAVKRLMVNSPRDIVGLIAVQCSPVRDVSTCSQEDSDVAHCTPPGES